MLVSLLQIDSSVIPLMSKVDLSKYIPLYGDRLAAVAFCRSHHLSDPGTSRRDQLLERIRSKVCVPESKAVKRVQVSDKLRKEIKMPKKGQEARNWLDEL